MNPEYKKNFLKAGAIAREVRAFGKSLLKPGASYFEVIRNILEKINQLGAIPAFPPQIAPNSIAAHYLPSPEEDIVFSNELLKLDIGVCYKGAIGDCAVTVDLSGNHQPLVDAAEAALLAAENILKVGLPVREIGRVIEETLCLRGFRPIRNLSGHGLGPYQIHTDPSIPNYPDHSKAVLKPGMTFAIEPFATTGKGWIYEAGTPMIFAFMSEKPVHSQLAKELLNTIKSFKNLPFSAHDLISSRVPVKEVLKGLKELTQKGILSAYGPLLEEKAGWVAQAENSVLIDEKGAVHITTR